jgi:hypothetical protein
MNTVSFRRKMLVVKKNFQLQKLMPFHKTFVCHQNKIPVTRTAFLAQEKISCHKNGFIVKEKLKLRFMDEHIFRKDRICLILF